jgi:hypothetical protein
MRVLPIFTGGLIENVNDLLYLKGVNVAIINSDSLEQRAGVANPASRSCTSSICVGSNFTFSFDPRSTRWPSGCQCSNWSNLG